MLFSPSRGTPGNRQHCLSNDAFVKVRGRTVDKIGYMVHSPRFCRLYPDEVLHFVIADEHHCCAFPSRNLSLICSGHTLVYHADCHQPTPSLPEWLATATDPKDSCACHSSLDTDAWGAVLSPLKQITGTCRNDETHRDGPCGYSQWDEASLTNVHLGGENLPLTEEDITLGR